MFRIPIVKPRADESVRREVMAVLDSGFWTEGPATRRFEDAVRERTGAKHALAATSCTTGLELGLRAMGVTDGDEVIVPSFTYPASAAAIAIVGAVPVIVDVHRDTMLIDLDEAASAVTPKTKAIMPVSEFGNPLDHDALAAFQHEHDLLVIEDAACAMGSTYRGRPTGSLADISVFSFHPRKIVSCGEGGMVTTDRTDWYEWMNSYKHFGMRVEDSRLRDAFDMVGTNYKLSDILGAVGAANMARLDEILAEHRRLAAGYGERLAGHDEIEIPTVTPGGGHSYQSFAVFVDDRDRVMSDMRSRGIEVQLGTYSLHRERAYQAGPRCRQHGDLASSRWVFDHCLTLPFFVGLTDDEQDEVVETLLEVIRTPSTVQAG